MRRIWGLFLAAIVPLVIVMIPGEAPALTGVTTPTPTCPAGSVPYASGTAWTGSQCLELYRPAGAGPFPAVVFVHGGAWKGGSFRSPTGWRADAAALAKLGYVAANIEYDRASVSRGTAYAQQPADVLAAVRFVTDPTRGLDVDPRRVAVVGESAGGHLALLAAHRNPSMFAGVVSWSGPGDLAELTRQFGCASYACSDQPSPQWVARAAQEFVGSCVAEPPLLPTGWRQCPSGRYAASSPVAHLESWSPPTLAAASPEDPLIPYAQHQQLVSAASSRGARLREVVVVGGTHGRAMRETESDPPGLWHAETIPFLDDCVKSPPCSRTGTGTVTTTSTTEARF